VEKGTCTRIGVFGVWKFSKACTYNLSYKSMVQQTIVEMVKAEALKNPPSKK
jgi:hypothetical protein